MGLHSFLQLSTPQPRRPKLLRTRPQLCKDAEENRLKAGSVLTQERSTFPSLIPCRIGSSVHKNSSISEDDAKEHGARCHVFSRPSFPVKSLCFADTEGLWLVSPELRSRQHQNANPSISCSGKKLLTNVPEFSQFLFIWIQKKTRDPSHLGLAHFTLPV